MLQREVGRRLAADGIRGGRKGAREDKKEGDRTGGESGELDWSGDVKEGKGGDAGKWPCAC